MTMLPCVKSFNERFIVSFKIRNSFWTYCFNLVFSWFNVWIFMIVHELFLNSSKWIMDIIYSLFHTYPYIMESLCSVHIFHYKTSLQWRHHTIIIDRHVWTFLRFKNSDIYVVQLWFLWNIFLYTNWLLPALIWNVLYFHVPDCCLNGDEELQVILMYRVWCLVLH